MMPEPPPWSMLLLSHSRLRGATSSRLADELANAVPEAADRPLVLDLTGISFVRGLLPQVPGDHRSADCLMAPQGS